MEITDACVLDLTNNVHVCPHVDYSGTVMPWVTVLTFIGFLMVIGYVLNIYKMIVRGDADPRLAIRAIGIFIPFIGGIVGWI